MYSSQNASRFHDPGPLSVITLARFALSGPGGKWTLSARAGGVSLAANLYLADTQPARTHNAAQVSAAATRNRGGSSAWIDP